tara:strand:- start:56 stop:313 length:258 start_codon:yes stop_codon:yes gene_type:complete
MKPLIVIMSTLATVSMIAFVGAFQACTGDTTQVKEVLDSADVQAVLEDVRVVSDDILDVVTTEELDAPRVIVIDVIEVTDEVPSE